VTDLVEPPLGVARDAHRRPALGYVIYFGAACFFALNGTVAKYLLLSGIPAERLSQFRVTASLLVLFLIVLVTNRKALRLKRSEIGTILAYGIAGVAMTQWLYFVSIARIPIGVSLVIEFTAPFMVALYMRFGRQQRQPRAVWLALAVALIGLAMVVQVWEGMVLDGIGVGAALLAAVALALYYIIGEKAVAQRDPVSLTMWGFAAAALFWAIAAPWWSFPWSNFEGTIVVGDAGPEFNTWLMAGWMVVMGTVVPFTMAVWSMKHITAAQASTVGMIEPVIATVIAFVLLGEKLVAVQLIGGAIVLGGVFWAERSRQPHP